MKPTLIFCTTCFPEETTRLVQDGITVTTQKQKVPQDYGCDSCGRIMIKNHAYRVDINHLQPRS